MMMTLPATVQHLGTQPSQVGARRPNAPTCRRAAVARLFDEAAAEGPEEQEEEAAAAAHAEDIEQLLGGGEGADAPSQSVDSDSSDEPAGDEGESAEESAGEEETEESGGEDDFLKDESSESWGDRPFPPSSPDHLLPGFARLCARAATNAHNTLFGGTPAAPPTARAGSQRQQQQQQQGAAPTAAGCVAAGFDAWLNDEYEQDSWLTGDEETEGDEDLSEGGGSV